MERVTRHEFEDRLTSLCVRSGMNGLPRKSRDRQILFKSIALLLVPGKVYSEAEVNQTIRLWLAAVAVRLQTDHVALRRNLVEHGYLVRDPRGAEYRLHEPSGSGIAFDTDVDTVDVLFLTIDATELLARQRRERFPRPGEDSGRRLMEARAIAQKLLAGSIDPQSACAQLASLYDHRFVFLLDLRWFANRHGLASEAIARLNAAAGFTPEYMARRFLESSEEWIEATAHDTGLQ
jgi:hypothetical protein